MSLQIYAGNLSYGMADESLKTLFEKFGEVSSAKIIRHQDTGRSKGFGFVEMPNDEEAEKAIQGLDGSEVDGRNIRVNRARPKRNE
ncbi:MAG: RNA-binding protein [Spirochaetes bacterium]|nr:RNA-binding protein [Spirochaetota bacterium]